MTKQGSRNSAKFARQVLARARRAGLMQLSESDGKAILHEFGITVPRGLSLDPDLADCHAIESLSMPLAVKLSSPDVVHKSDGGYVALNLASPEAVMQTAQKMRGLAETAGQRVAGFLVEEMAPPGQELVVGFVRDQSFGPVLMVGLGGILVEVLGDVAFRLCPIEEIDAREMIDELRGSPVLDGARGKASIDRDALVNLLMAIGGSGGLAQQLSDDVAELDINPVIASGTNLVAVDARFILSRRGDLDV